MEARRAAHRRRTVGIAIAVAAVAMLVPAFALAHIERASYWPDPAPDTSVKPAAGGSVPAVRSLYSVARRRRSPARRGSSARRCRASKLRKHGTPEQLSKNKSMKALNKDLKTARKNGYKLRESQPAIKISKKKAKKLRKTQHQAAAAVQVQVDPGCGHGLAQQRPRRDHAGPLHRAEVARQADQRPGLRPVQDHQRQEPGRRGLLRLPVALPERPEPDRGPRPSADQHSRARSRRGSTATSSRTRGPASAATCRSRAPASRPTTSRSTPATPPPGTARRSGQSRTSASGPTAPTASSSTTSRSAMPRSTTSTRSRPTAPTSITSRSPTPASTACSPSSRTTR